MKTTTTLTAIATLFASAVFAQTGPEALTITATGNSIGQPSMTIEFSGHGSGFYDVYDTASASSALSNSTIGPSNNLDSLMTLPANIVSFFTMSDDQMAIDRFDSRPSIDRTTALSFGILSSIADTISISASAVFGIDSLNASNNETINYVYLEDLSTGIFYQILDNNVTLPISANVMSAMNYVLHIIAKPLVTTTSATCFTSTNGTISMHNPFCSNWHYNIYDNGNLIFNSSASNPDTTLYNFAPNFYDVALYMDNLLVDSEKVHVNSPAQVIPSFSALSGNSALENEQILFMNQSSGADFFDWSFGDATTDSVVNPLHAYSVAGNYAVTLTARDSNGCTASFTDTMFISPSQSLHQGPTIGHRITNSSSDPTARTNNSNEVNVAGNELKITVNQNNEEQLLVQIMNMNGQLISSTSTTETSTSFDVPATGVYVVTITSANGTVVSKKVAVAN